MSGRVFWVTVVAVVLLGAGRIAATYSVFNSTIDEDDHIEAGLEYWQLDRYAYEAQHPPLARITLAALPYLFRDLRLDERRMLHAKRYTKPLDEPREPLERFLWAGAWHDAAPAEYWRTLSLARAGNLVFWAALAVLVMLWARDLFGPTAGIAAGLWLVCSPTVLAHAGLATLDLAAAAMAIASVYTLDRWARSGRWGDAAWAGLAAGLAVTSKFSLLAFLPPAWLAVLWVSRPRDARATIRQVGLAGVVAFAAIWAVYGFDFGPLAPEGRVYVSPEESGSPAAIARWTAQLLASASLPAPALFRGVIDVMAHNAGGHPSYLLGEWTREGNFSYFPIALAVKTSLPLLALAIWGAIVVFRDGPLWRRALPVLALAASTLAVAILADINIGVRHILPVYPCLAILAAAPFRDWRMSLGRPARIAGALLLLHVGESAWAHPDYLPYFNEIARGREERFLLDSNLDWGQDLARLGDWMEATGTPAVVLRYFGDAGPATLGVNNFILPSGHPDAGWFAISANFLHGMEGASPQLRALVQQEPEARIGKSIHVYRIRPQDVPLITPPWFLENYEATAPPDGFNDVAP